MQPLIVVLLLMTLSFSSCFTRQSADNKADDALGLDTNVDQALAQQEMQKIQKAQFEEQKRQLDRQITDPINPPR